jgi:5-formyltetrahydrofolate cyclo-ligase
MMQSSKSLIRKSIKAQQRAMSMAEMERQSVAVQQKLESLPQFINAKTVLLFWSLPYEISIHSFIEKWAKEKTILLPVLINNDILLRRFSGVEHLSTGLFNIQEPVSNDFTDFDSIDLAIIPGLAFSPDGSRLGRGKGFYDRLLPKINAPKIAVCFDFQLLDTLPTDEWDVKMDAIVC